MRKWFNIITQGNMQSLLRVVVVLVVLGSLLSEYTNILDLEEELSSIELCENSEQEPEKEEVEEEFSEFILFSSVPHLINYSTRIKFYSTHLPSSSHFDEVQSPPPEQA